MGGLVVAGRNIRLWQVLVIYKKAQFLTAIKSQQQFEKYNIELYLQ